MLQPQERHAVSPLYIRTTAVLFCTTLNSLLLFSSLHVRPPVPPQWVYAHNSVQKTHCISSPCFSGVGRHLFSSSRNSTVVSQESDSSHFAVLLYRVRGLATSLHIMPSSFMLAHTNALLNVSTSDRRECTDDSTALVERKQPDALKAPAVIKKDVARVSIGPRPPSAVVVQYG